MLISQTMSCHSTFCSWWGNTFKKAVSSTDPFSVFCFIAFANLFSVYDGKVAISLKNCTKGRKQISEVRNFLLNSLSCISEVVAFLHKHLDTECWMVKPKTLNAAWVLLTEWTQDTVLLQGRHGKTNTNTSWNSYAICSGLIQPQ